MIDTKSSDKILALSIKRFMKKVKQNDSNFTGKSVHYQWRSEGGGQHLIVYPSPQSNIVRYTGMSGIVQVHAPASNPPP